MGEKARTAADITKAMGSSKRIGPNRNKKYGSKRSSNA